MLREDMNDKELGKLSAGDVVMTWNEYDLLRHPVHVRIALSAAMS